MFGGYSREPFNDTRIISDGLDESGFGRFTAKIIDNIGEEGIDYP